MTGKKSPSPYEKVFEFQVNSKSQVEFPPTGAILTALCGGDTKEVGHTGPARTQKTKSEKTVLENFRKRRVK